MDLVADLNRMGGVATRAQLLRLSSRREVDAALREGFLIPVARGRYVAATAEAAPAAAHAVTGVVAGRSAALHWGWAVRTVPPCPEVIVPKDRRVPAPRRAGLALWWADLGPDDVRDGVTSPDRTLTDCLRRLDAAEALSVADSALRDGFPPSRLLALARDVSGPGGRNARWVARHSDGRAANPFESSLRAIALTVEGLQVVPQMSIYGPRFLGRPDLVDERLGIVLECDSFEFHGDRSALDRDACRYNRLVVHGWMVLRFSWEQVMLRPLEVRAVLEAAVRQRTDQRRAAGLTA